MSPDVLASLLSSLWPAAFVVLVAVKDVSTEKRRILQAAAGDSLVDFVDSANLNSKELLEQILSHAESLRVRRAGAFPGEGH